MAETKEFILQEAYKLFLQKSYESVSISDISEAIGLTKGALYHHFLNKEDLFKAVVEKYLSVISLRDIREGVTLAEFIELNIDHIERIMRTIPIDDMPFIPVNYTSLLIDALRHCPGFAGDKERLFAVEIGKLKGILKQAMEAGEIRANIDPEVVSSMFFSITVGVAADLFRWNSTEQTLDGFRKQMFGLYALLKKET